MTLVQRIKLVLYGGPLLALILSGAWLHHAVTTKPQAEGEVRIEVPKGTTGRQLVATLHDQGLAPHPRVTYWWMRYEDTFAAMQAGGHVLPADASVQDLARLLKHPPAHPELSLTLLPGETVWHTAERIAAAGLATSEAVLHLAADRDHVRSLGLPVGPKRDPRPDGVPHTYLEGFLTPETHFVSPDAPLEDIIATLTSPFTAMWTPLLRRRKSDLMVLQEHVGLSPFQVLVLASLVEREAKVAAEAATIAGVFVNRLRRGMRLQTDPTLVYRPDRARAVPTPAHRKDGTNPYNTYAHDGLPPGPICSPTRQTIEATLTPGRHDYLYFCARRDGTGRHAFARTLAEHEANVRRYLSGK